MQNGNNITSNDTIANSTITITRQLHRQLSRRVAEYAISKLLGAIPRKARRLAGRGYGNAAYRTSKGLMDRSPKPLSPDLLNWISNETDKLINNVLHPIN